MDGPAQFVIQLHCGGCGREGTAAWECDPGRGRDRFLLIHLSDGFYERMGKKTRNHIEIVCHGCGLTVSNDSMAAAERAAGL